MLGREKKKNLSVWKQSFSNDVTRSSPTAFHGNDAIVYVQAPISLVENTTFSMNRKQEKVAIATNFSRAKSVHHYLEAF